MTDQDIAILVPLAAFWTFVFSLLIILLASLVVQSIDPRIAIPAGAICAVAWLRYRGVI